ncbi:ZYBA0S03-09868g1_1 [Zygosaccharomyces bailii CLIB 213]|uniref:ZYBA0S03-09868g1_1 n=1 Tax=Zygosaccharomyces bailii (strain CLIB 213 / ATCC 58445 / CBS 680 / BCRC 21525 / NBRC 1098 / NCYC 1416 / NRRL Y-2227) TaxID=1333698 RepID=A0A8J2X7F1_ZYGB2|nr:ZYBA0S03-09868g1_1 [Zygosaccharomyces bailii CLIB 213]
MDRDSVAIIAPGGQSYSSSNIDPQMRSRTSSTSNDSSDHDMAVASKPLLKLKLLDSLRQGDFKQLDTLVRNEFQPEDDPNVEEVKNLMLHYAVQVAPTSLIKEIVNQWSNASSTSRKNAEKAGITIDINYRDQNGDTPLHLSAFQSRADVVEFLMDQPGINDCILNNSHLQPIEMCRNLGIAQMMQTKRATYVAEIAQEFRTAFNNRDFGHLEAILSNPRNAELLDINGTDPETGDTVLHEFVKKRDVIMCRWLLEHGADPFNRDRQGRLPIDLVGKVNENDSATNTKVAIDIELKKLLGKAAKEQSVIDVTNNLHEAPTHKGYLKKWTNFAQGYKLRWFILSIDGKLSYYKDQADTKNACRGSLNMSTCYLHLDSSEKLKFEIIGGSNGAIRWHLKANHPIETNRWVWAIQGAIRYAKDKELMMKSGTVPPSLAMSRGLNPGGRHESPLYSSQLQHSQGNRRASSQLDDELGMSEASQQGKAHSFAGNRNRMSSASLGSSELRLNDNLTESGKLYVNRMVGNRIDSGSHDMPSHTASNTSRRHSSQKSLLNNFPNGIASQDGNAKVNNYQRQAAGIQSDVDQQKGPAQEPNNSQTKEAVPKKPVNISNDFVAAKVNEPTEKSVDNSASNGAIDETSSNEDDLENTSEDADGDNRDQNSNFDVDDQEVKTQYGPYSQRLLMIQRSLSMELSSLNELLDSGHPNEEVWVTLKKSLPSLSNTFEKLYFLTSERDKKLGAMLTKQREVNNVWIQSVKDLELELIEKSNRLASLDKERRGLKRLLHKKLAEAGSSPDGSQFNSVQPRKLEDSNATLEGIAKFIEATKEEDEDSDADIFFDAEDLVDSSSEDENSGSQKSPEPQNFHSSYDSGALHAPDHMASHDTEAHSGDLRTSSESRENHQETEPSKKGFSIHEPPSRAPPDVPSNSPPPVPRTSNHFDQNMPTQRTLEQDMPDSHHSFDRARVASSAGSRGNPFRQQELQQGATHPNEHHHSENHLSEHHPSEHHPSEYHLSEHHPAEHHHSEHHHDSEYHPSEHHHSEHHHSEYHSNEPHSSEHVPSEHLPSEHHSSEHYSSEHSPGEHHSSEHHPSLHHHGEHHPSEHHHGEHHHGEHHHGEHHHDEHGDERDQYAYALKNKEHESSIHNNRISGSQSDRSRFSNSPADNDNSAEMKHKKRDDHTQENYPSGMKNDSSGSQRPISSYSQKKEPEDSAAVATGAAVGATAGNVSKHDSEKVPKKDLQDSKNSTPNSLKKSSSKLDEKSLPIQGVTEPQKEKSAIILREGSFLGYEDGLRKKLKLDEDDRPAISLWSVLKSMVGKDMTRMTLPVTFNEPTSLLQRVAEDLEYTDLLDMAASFDDPTLRLLYIAVFTASSYASTIKRVAKPFNPLLGETFEYSRPDKGYRFFTEQISHHPVISASWTESPKWDFWGESNVDTKFNGRSFGIKHHGLWYIKMRPNNGSPEELYTWKKPDNTVIGILVGNPQVDNHGEVVVRNHTTGDRCIINFKARGWRSSGAYEVTGEVFNKKNEKKWVLGGHWNDSIYAKMHTSKNKGDIMKTQDASSNGPKLDGSKFLVWKAAPRPEAPFHLTPFAITLNAPQPSLLPWLAPTDTRLRPDQRDMEEGLYDEAGDEKHRLEEKQRAKHRKRVENHETYKPLWFHKETHPITKAEYWQYNGEYWKLRKDHKLKNVSPDIF